MPEFSACIHSVTFPFNEYPEHGLCVQDPLEMCEVGLNPDGVNEIRNPDDGVNEIDNPDLPAKEAVPARDNGIQGHDEPDEFDKMENITGDSIKKDEQEEEALTTINPAGQESDHDVSDQL